MLGKMVTSVTEVISYPINKKIFYPLTSNLIYVNIKLSLYVLVGEVSEWFKELVLKTSDPERDQGFESLPLRHISKIMEKYPRGRRGSPAKGVGRVTGARVQIPPSPPIINSFCVYRSRSFLLCYFINNWLEEHIKYPHGLTIHTNIKRKV